MTDQEKTEFQAILTGLAEIFDNELSPMKISLYYGALQDLDLSQIKAAASHIANTATFFPKPVDFRNAINGNQDEVAIAAWEKVLKAKSKAGQYQSVKFDDPVIHTVIKLMGGWGAVCRLEGHDDEKWQRIDFEKTYKAMQGCSKDHPLYLPGVSEIQNGAQGFSSKKEVMAIGEKVELLRLEEKV